MCSCEILQSMKKYNSPCSSSPNTGKHNAQLNSKGRMSYKKYFSLKYKPCYPEIGQSEVHLDTPQILNKSCRLYPEPTCHQVQGGICITLQCEMSSRGGERKRGEINNPSQKTVVY